jgi:biotin carboxylase
LGLPLVLKLDDSWGGEGVLIAESRQEAVKAFRRLGRQSRLRNVFRALRGRGTHFLTQALYPVSPRISAQHFISGTAATSSFACWRGKVVASHHFDVRVSTTPTSPASVIAVSDCRQMAATAEAVAQAFNLSGLFGLDYIRDASGQVHLLEMNRRATPTMHLALEQDPVASLLKAAGLPASFRPPVTDKKQIALFPREWLRDPASPWLARAYHDVPWDDPAVMRACVKAGSAEARDRLRRSGEAPLTTEKPIFGG